MNPTNATRDTRLPQEAPPPEGAPTRPLEWSMPKWLRFVYSVRWPLSVLIVLAMSLFAWYAVPKKKALSAGYSGVAYYRGFGWMEGDGMLGKRFYAADFTFEHEQDERYTKYDVRYRGGDQAYFKGYYRSGATAYEGECLIALLPDGYPEHLDLVNGAWAKYYKPDGTLGSEVIDGTGRHTWWTEEGEKSVEIKVNDSKWLHRTRWYPSGQVRSHLPFVDGLVHGQVTDYWPNGRVRSVITYAHGRPTGRTATYREDGSLKTSSMGLEP